MACGDVLSLEDLQTAKKHQIFEAEVITGKVGGIAGGATIDTATNQVTGQTQQTLPSILADLGFDVQSWTSSTGGVLASANQVFLNNTTGSLGLGDYYAWGGTFPKTVPAGTDPALVGSGYIMRSSRLAGVQAREALRRSYAKAGYKLVNGSFESGGTLVSANDVLLQERTGKAFSGPSGTVAAGTNPASGGFIDQSPVTSVSTPFAKSTEVDIFVIYGQSNARGYAGNTPGDIDYAAENVKVWNGSTAIALTSYTPTPNDGTSTGSAWKAFGNTYNIETGRAAIIINAGKGSQSISDLQKGSSNYTGLLNWTNGAKGYIASLGKSIGKIGVIFIQGEADATLATSAKAYTTLANTLFDDLIGDIGAETFFILPIGTYSSGKRKTDAFQIQSAQRRLCYSRSDTVNAFEGLQSLGKYKVDGVHFTQKGYNFIGEQIAINVRRAWFDTKSSISEPIVSNKQCLRLDSSQDWESHGGWITKASGAWVVSNDANRASSNIISVVAMSDHLLVTLADRVDYIYSFNGSSLSRTGRVSVNARCDFGVFQDVDSEGRTVLKVYLETPLALVVDTAAQTITTTTGDTAIASMFTPTWGTGSCSISHPSTVTPAVCSDRAADASALVLAACSSFETNTTVRLHDPASPATRKNGKVTVSWGSIRLNPTLMSDGSEITFQLIASKKQAF